MTLQIIQILVNCLGFGIIIFGCGKYIGSTNVTLLNIISTQKELKEDFKKHVENDLEHFEKIQNNISDWKTRAAGHGK